MSCIITTNCNINWGFSWSLVPSHPYRSNNSRLSPKLFLLSLCLGSQGLLSPLSFMFSLLLCISFIGSYLSFLFSGLIFSVACYLSYFYPVLSSSNFILASTLCLEVRLCGLLSVVLLLILVLLSLNLLFLVS